MNLYRLRKENQKTQQELANYLNIARATYNGYELEKFEPNIEALKKLADYYHVSLDYLVGRQFGKDLGYINDFDYNFIKRYLTLTNDQKAFIAGSVFAQSLNI